jgi:hypothetical protein
MIRPTLWFAATLAALPAPAVAAAAPPPPTAACEVPADLVAPAQPLRNLGGSLQPGGRLDVLAIGSGTLLGPRGGVDGSVPDHMLKALHDTAPGVGLYLFLHGARAETATAMLAAMRKEFSTHSYQLVLWQTGTVEAVRKLPLAQFRDTLGEGAAAAAAAGADLVLIDVPYSRLLEDNADLLPYRAAMQDLADAGKAALFRRYDLMRHWAETGVLDMEAAGRHEQHNTADRLRTCLGDALAKLVLAARGA